MTVSASDISVGAAREVAYIWEALRKSEATAEIRAQALADHVNQLRALHDIAHAREHELNDRAVDKNSETLNGRLATMNEFRHQIESERATYITGPLLDSELRRLTEAIEQNAKLRTSQLDSVTKALTDRLNIVSGRLDTHDAYINTQMGKFAVWGLVAAGFMTVLVVLISYLLRV